MEVQIIGLSNGKNGVEPAGEFCIGNRMIIIALEPLNSASKSLRSDGNRQEYLLADMVFSQA